jgi:hypothetical protein
VQEIHGWLRSGLLDSTGGHVDGKARFAPKQESSERVYNHKQKATKLLYIEDTNQQVELEIGGSTRINRESKEGKAMMDELSQQLVGQDQVESLE